MAILVVILTGKWFRIMYPDVFEQTGILFEETVDVCSLDVHLILLANRVGILKVCLLLLRVT